uniref:Nuclear nucleic acid-binding protein C1D n=1 Tax=Ciona savignyi TaxID=51511 RepID=H2Y4M5_CIOSA
MAEDDYPQELNDVFKSFDANLSKVEETLKPMLTSQRSDLTREMDPIDNAKLDLVAAYAVNSFYWTYLIANGVNPKSHPVKSELDRIKTYMGKIKEIEDKKNAPKLQKEAAKRFIRSAMFDGDNYSNVETKVPKSIENDAVVVSTEAAEVVEEPTTKRTKKHKKNKSIKKKRKTEQ